MTKPKHQKNKGFDTDFDTFWKEALDLVEPATAFFLPNLHALTDWSKDYQSLEQELRSLRARKKGVVRRTDKLFRLDQKDGGERFVLFHIEAEAFPDASFPQRIPEKAEEEFQTHYLDTYHTEDMTGREEALAYGKNLTDRISSHLYGETTEEAQRRVEVERRAREDAQRKMAEVILNLHQKLGWSAEKIAETLELDLQSVKAILAR